jgi:hypothetical protein
VEGLLPGRQCRTILLSPQGVHDSPIIQDGLIDKPELDLNSRSVDPTIAGLLLV